MSRVKRSVHARKKRRETLAMAKGYPGRRQPVVTARPRKPCSRPTSIATATAATASATSVGCGSRASTRLPGINGLSYSQFMHGLKLADVELDRKVLADIAVHDADTFRRFAERAREALAAG